MFDAFDENISSLSGPNSLLELKENVRITWHVISYLLFLSGGWFSFEDASIHGLNILYHHAKHLVTEIKHQLREKGWTDQSTSKEQRVKSKAKVFSKLMN